MSRCGNKHLLIIVETRKGAQTDDTYIKETIKRFYSGINDFTPKFIYMESKGAYSSQKVNHEIKEYSKYSNVIGVVLCVDTDDYDISINDAKLNERIMEHCKNKGYDFVWFCKNVEDVFYSNAIVAKNKKVIKAKQFIQNKMIDNIEEKYLRSEQYSKSHSNVLNVLDKYYKKAKIS